ncbi:MAG: polysaccharide biosynthesis/export family protein, partial [Blastocatellia bacterium]
MISRKVTQIIVALSVIVLPVTANFSGGSAFALASQSQSQSQSPHSRRAGTESQQANQAPAMGPPAVSPGVLYSADDDYRIGVGDVLQINVQDGPELSGMFRVNSSGSILMPFLGRLIVLGATPEDLQKQIADGLRGQYLLDPQISVVVAQYTSRTFFIQGAVRMPGVFQIEGHPSLLKLITLAGGLQEDHGSTAFIIREIKSFSEEQAGAKPASATRPRTIAPGTITEDKPGQSASPATLNPKDNADLDDAKYELRKVNINGLLRGNFSQNVVIQPGDIINIPPTDVFFVAGEVRSPGSFPLRDGTTLRQAISLAQGMTFRARPGAGVIFREDPATGKRQEIKVDLNEVMSGKKPDIN